MSNYWKMKGTGRPQYHTWKAKKAKNAVVEASVPGELACNTTAASYLSGSRYTYIRFHLSDLWDA